MKIFFVILLSLFCQVSWAGWGSSGGELLRDSQNPWWVKNTTTVNYCVQIDQEGISATPAKINELIAKAFAFWTRDFSRSLDYVQNGTDLISNFRKLGVGTQTFTQISCNGTQDLTFQFGYKTLTKLQLKKINDPTNFIAMAVRTDYDQFQLKGKGFIFVSSDKGRYKYDSGPNLVAQPWSTDALLYFILLHEIGHVFGIPHVGIEYSIMSQQCPELLLNKLFSSIMAKANLDDVGQFFFPANRFKMCTIMPAAGLPQKWSPATKDFFGITDANPCVTFEINDKTKEIAVGTSDADGKSIVNIGKITGASYTPTYSPVVSLRITPLQKIFPISESTFSTIFGPSFVEIDVTDGVFMMNSGARKPVSLNLTNMAYKIFGLTDQGISLLGNAYQFGGN